MLLCELLHLGAAFETDHFVILDGILRCECGFFLLESFLMLLQPLGIAISVPVDSAFCSSWRVLKTCRRDEVISAAVMGVKDTCVWTISDAISMSFLGIGDPLA